MANEVRNQKHPQPTAVDMSAAAIAARLDKVGQLFELSRLLKSARRVGSEALSYGNAITIQASEIAESPAVNP